MALLLFRRTVEGSSICGKRHAAMTQQSKDVIASVLGRKSTQLCYREKAGAKRNEKHFCQNPLQWHYLL
jgi:hypothetical protein